jgi:hypothetical protein
VVNDGYLYSSKYYLNDPLTRSDNDNGPEFMELQDTVSYSDFYKADSKYYGYIDAIRFYSELRFFLRDDFILARYFKNNVVYQISSGDTRPFKQRHACAISGYLRYNQAYGLSEDKWKI